MKNTKENKKKVLVGKVVSVKMKDTIVVAVDSYKKHPKYGKYILRQKKIMAEDLGNKCKEGEIVKIIETRPISKNKSFEVVNNQIQESR